MRVLTVAAISVLVVATSALATRPVRNSDGTYPAIAAAKTARPAAPPTLQTFYDPPGSVFRFHYDVTGANAVPSIDLLGNGIPDWIDSATVIGDSALTVYAAFGLDTSIGDGGYYGSARYDVYFWNLAPQGLYGRTFDGPNGYMEMDNDFGETIYSVPGLLALKVTFAHELVHAIQFRYPGLNSSTVPWWLEMTATFMEDVVYDDINDYWQYLDPVGWQDSTIFEKPRKGLAFASFPYSYGACIFVHYLREKYPSVIAPILAESFALPAPTAAAITGIISIRTGLSMRNVLADFWIWSYFTGDRARSGYFREAAHYRPAPLTWPYPDNAIANVSQIGGTASGTISTFGLGASLFRIPPDGSSGSVRVTLTGLAPYADSWSWRIVLDFGDHVVALPNDNPWARPTRESATYEVVIPNSAWESAQDICVIGCNGVTDEIALPRTPSSVATVKYTFAVTYIPPVSIVDADLPPAYTGIEAPSPNPFNADLSIPVALDRDQEITLAVYDIAGRRVRTIADRLSLSAGYHRFSWDGRDGSGHPAGSGLYLLHLASPVASSVRTVTLVR